MVKNTRNIHSHGCARTLTQQAIHINEINFIICIPLLSFCPFLMYSKGQRLAMHEYTLTHTCTHTVSLFLSAHFMHIQPACWQWQWRLKPAPVVIVRPRSVVISLLSFSLIWRLDWGYFTLLWRQKKEWEPKTRLANLDWGFRQRPDEKEELKAEKFQKRGRIKERRR